MFNSISYVSDWKVNAKLNSLANMTKQGFLTVEDVEFGRDLCRQIKQLTLESGELSTANKAFVMRIVGEIEGILANGVQTVVDVMEVKQ